MVTWRRARDARGLGQHIATLRRERRMTQAELAQWLGVDRTTVVRLEAGNLRAVKRLTEALSVLGADLVVVPREAQVTVEAADRP
ncbi:helix-turn-helix domain-containing protein [Natronosporangium hydrolyticum]|uniref:Helix-turn-helix domain-containing protein n=1 Tax=Natronosporangium hydrolyticum TaxID=2811111 RepID=A0A895YH72_9ACTN|nr:helix-turn-helix domain-containing protein [Natronosporangium hydrolyticum]QSB15405.1 helix-turn-helix domain-containing protein [Natronosporangium hydrolyticum]